MQLIFSAEIEHQVCSLNIWGWGPRTTERIRGIKKLLIDEAELKSSKVLFVQESIEKLTGTTAEFLAKEMGWLSYFVKRKGDPEGLAFIYSPELNVLEKNYYHIKAKYSEDDYSRLVISLQVEDPDFGKIRYVNTHLAHEPYMSETRKEQLQEILGWLQDVESINPSAWVVFGGDFNTGPTESYYQKEFSVLNESLFNFHHSPHDRAAYSWSNLMQGSDLRTELIDHFHVGSLSEDTHSLHLKSNILTQSIERGLSDHSLLRLTLKLNKDNASLVAY